jgi:hypothetical protein
VLLDERGELARVGRRPADRDERHALERRDGAQRDEQVLPPLERTHRQDERRGQGEARRDRGVGRGIRRRVELRVADLVDDADPLARHAVELHEVLRGLLAHRDDEARRARALELEPVDAPIDRGVQLRVALEDEVVDRHHRRDVRTLDSRR